MCDPISITMVALTAAEQFYSADQTRHTSNMAADAARANYYANDAALHEEQSQSNEAATQQMSQRAVDAMRERGRLEAAMAGTGLGGAGYGRLMNESALNETTDMATITSNAQARSRQFSIEGQTAARHTNQEIAALPRFNLIGAGLQIGAAALGTPAVGKYTKGLGKTTPGSSPIPFNPDN